MTTFRSGLAVASALACLALTAPAFAQGAPPAPAPAPAAAPPDAPGQPAADPKAGDPSGEGAADDPKLEEARQRYKRGVQLFNEANYEAARVEFERAFQLAPSYKILYNIGLSYEQLGDYVQALSTLQRYLELGAKEIPEERKAEVSKELAQIRPRIARMLVKLNISGVEILVDDACATDASTFRANCGPTGAETREILLNPGRRRLTFKKAGYNPETSVVTVAGGDKGEIPVKMTKQYVEKKSNPHVVPMIIGWGATAAFAGGAIITGVLANNAAEDQQAAVDRLGVTRGEIDSAEKKTKTLSLVTDGLWIGTGIAAIAGTYFTFRALSWKGGEGDVKVQVGLGSLRLGGHF